MILLGLLQILSLAIPSLAEPPCSGYSVNDCQGDVSAEIIQFTTRDLTKCQQHCALFDDCTFYAFYDNPIQSVDCHIFREPFNAYLNHCNIRQGVKSGGSNGNCITPDEFTCEVEQTEGCNPYGSILESNIPFPTPEACRSYCDINADCKMWEFDVEKVLCSTYNSAEKMCNIKFGPPNTSPGDCGTVTDPPPTPDPNQSTPRPGVCGIDCQPGTELQLFADCENCGKYYECSNGVLTSMPCPNCYLFDPEKGYCNQPSQVNCGNRPEDDNCVAPTLPGDCPYSDGYFKDPHDCDQYIICRNGEASFESCVNNTFSGLYNYEKQWCDFENRVNCEDRPICRGPADYTQCQCQGAAVQGPEDCAGSTNTEYRSDPYNCQRVVICRGGAQTDEYICPPGQYWNQDIISCVDDSSVCKGRPVCQDVDNTFVDCSCV